MKPFDINPVSVKEFRQLTRSRHIRNALVAFLALQIVVAMIVINVMRDAKTGLLTDSETGVRMFDFMALLLNLAIMAVLPGNVFWRMLSENRYGKTDPLLATTLSTGRFVNGKLFSGVVMILFFIAASLPFLTLSYLLRGIAISVIMQYVFLALAVACVLVHVAVLAASLRLPDALRKVMFLMFFTGAVSYMISMPFIFTEFLDDIDEVWMFFTGVSAGTASVCLVARALAISQLAPPHTDRAVQLRVTTAVIALAATALTSLFNSIPPHVDDDWREIGAALTLFGAVALLFIECSANPGIARRSLIDRPKNLFKRFLRFPLATGPVPGILHAVALFGFSLLYHMRPYDRVIAGTAVFALLAAALLLVTRAVWNFSLKRFGFPVKFVGALGSALFVLANVFGLFNDVNPNDAPHTVRMLCACGIVFFIALLLNLPEALPVVRTYFRSAGPAEK